MIEAGKADLMAERHAPFIFQILVEGIDLTAASFFMQVRLCGDAPGSPLINLVTAAPGSQGISAALSGSDTVLTIRIVESALNALPLGGNPDVALSYDLQIQPLGGDREVWFYGEFFVRGGATFVAPPVPHRYWRLSVVHSAEGDAFVAAGELEFRETPGGAAVTSGTWATSSENVGAPLSQAHDGNTSTVWNTNISPTFPVTVTRDFGAGNAKAIQEIYWYPRSDAPSRGPSQLDIQWSDDGTSWTNSWSVTGISGWTAGVAKVFTKP